MFGGPDCADGGDGDACERAGCIHLDSLSRVTPSLARTHTNACAVSRMYLRVRIVHCDHHWEARA